MSASESIRGFRVSDVVAALAATEAALGWNPVPRKYVRLGYWFVESALCRALWRQWWRGDAETYIPHFTLRPRRRTVAKAWRDWKIFKGIEAALAADAICIRNNVRAFYSDKSLKLLMSRSRELSNMRNDVAARARMAAHQTVRVPRILRHDLECDLPYIVEELVKGRRLHPRRDAALVAGIIAGPLWATYTKEGFHFREVAAIIDLGDLQPLLKFCCAALALPDDGFAEKVAAILEGGGRMTCSFGHGDLSYSNILVAPDGTPWFLDWECARELPIVCDLIRLFVEMPEGRLALEKCMAKVSGEAVLGFAHQLMAAAVERLLQWARAQPNLEAAKLDSPKIAHFFNLAAELL